MNPEWFIVIISIVVVLKIVSKFQTKNNKTKILAVSEEGFTYANNATQAHQVVWGQITDAEIDMSEISEKRYSQQMAMHMFKNGFKGGFKEKSKELIDKYGGELRLTINKSWVYINIKPNREDAYASQLMDHLRNQEKLRVDD